MLIGHTDDMATFRLQQGGACSDDDGEMGKNFLNQLYTVGLFCVIRGAHSCCAGTVHVVCRDVKKIGVKGLFAGGALVLKLLHRKLPSRRRVLPAGSGHVL